MLETSGRETEDTHVMNVELHNKQHNNITTSIFNNDNMNKYERGLQPPPTETSSQTTNAVKTGFYC